MRQTAKLAGQLKTLHSLAGSDCIYKDSGRIRLVRVVNVNYSKDVIEFELKALETAGLGRRAPSSFEISCNIGYLNFREKHLHAPYVNWMLITDSKVVRHLVKFAAELPKTQAFLNEMYRKLEEPPIKAPKKAKSSLPK